MLASYLPPEKNVETTVADELRNSLEKDFAVRYVNSSLSGLTLLPGGIIEVSGQTFPCTQNFMEALAAVITMPVNYAYDLEYGLFQHNFEKRKGIKDHAVRICIIGDRAVGLADGDYRPAKTTDVLDALDALDNGFWKFQKSSISDGFVQIDLVSEDLVVTPKLGDDIRSGIRITNSETGGFALKASIYTYRQVCSNGAVMNDRFGTVRWNYDKRVTYAASIAKFSDSLPTLREGQTRLKDVYIASLDRRVPEEIVTRVWRRIRSAGKIGPEDADTILGMTAEERHRVEAAVADRRASRQPEQPSAWDAFSMHNRITDAAKRFPLARRSHLERIGGGLLDYSFN